MVTVKNELKIFNLKNLLSFILLFLSFIPGVYYMQIGVDFSDEPYQILNACDWKNTPLAPLTAFVSHFVTLSTVSVFSFRCVALTLIYSSILCAGVFLYVNTKKLNIAINTTAFAIWLTGFSHMKGWLYGWDSFSYASLTFVGIALLSYVKRPSNKWLVLTLIAACVSTLCRLPNMLCMFICGGIIIISLVINGSTKSKAIMIGLTYYLISAIVCLLVLILMYGSITNYLAYFNANKLSEHNGLALVLNTANHALLYVPYICMFGSFYWFLKKYICDNSAIWIRYSSYICLTLILIGYGIFFFSLVSIIHFWNSLLLLGCFELIRRFDNKKDMIAGWALLLLGLVSCAGSNNGLVKLLAGGMMPLLMVFLYKRWNNAANVLCVIFFISYTSLSIYKRQFHSYTDIGTNEATAVISAGPLKGLKTSEETAEMIRSALADVKPYQDANYQVKVLGRSLHRFSWELTFNDRNELLRHWWSSGERIKDIPGYIEYVSSVAASETPTLVFWYNDASPESLRKSRYKITNVWEKDTLNSHMIKLPVKNTVYELYTNYPLK